MFKVLQIDHVELFVPDRDDAARWYERVLGLQVVRECEEWAVGGGPLMISSDDGRTKLALFEGQPTRVADTAAFRRVAFSVTGEQFLEFLRRLSDLELRDSRGNDVTAASPVDHDKAFSIYFNDPFDHQLEVTSYDHALIRAALVAPT